MFGSTTKLQRDLSVRTINSRATADTLEGSLIAPNFKFGIQKNYRQLQDMDSRKGERKKAETTLKLGITVGQSSAKLVDAVAPVSKSPKPADGGTKK